MPWLSSKMRVRPVGLLIDTLDWSSDCWKVAMRILASTTKELIPLASVVKLEETSGTMRLSRLSGSGSTTPISGATTFIRTTATGACPSAGTPPRSAEITNSSTGCWPSTGASFEDLKAHYRQIGTIHATYFECDRALGPLFPTTPHDSADGKIWKEDERYAGLREIAA